MDRSPLEKLRLAYEPSLPKILQSRPHFSPGEATSSPQEIKNLFPRTCGRPIMRATAGASRPGHAMRVGVVLSGGQAAGGHNVIAGLLDGLMCLSSESRLLGFLDGPSGIVNNKTKELTPDLVRGYRNLGGFDMIGSGRTKIETDEQLKGALQTAVALKLDAIVVIGGDDSNTNAAILAEYFLANNCKTVVVGVPKTIDGDLKNSYIPASFGFDTACKTYNELIGNIGRDAMSAKKYTHFIKLMGRSASHIALECGLSCHPNMVLIGEEVAHKKMTLAQLTAQVVDVITRRMERGLNYGVILVPEGLIEFIPEVGTLIGELNQHGTPDKISAASKSCFDSLPEEIQKQLLLDRDPHGNVQVSLIETEKLLISAVSRQIKGKFSSQAHFFGYEGRAGFPSNFDAHYCYALGHVASLLCSEGLTGYISCVGNLHLPTPQWTVAGLPITQMMNMEMRKGKSRPVIQKALVDLKGRPFAALEKQRAAWALGSDYRFPGPIQFFGDKELTDATTLTLQLEAGV